MSKGRKAKQLEAVNLLEIRPLRVAQWEREGDRVTVIRPRPTGRLPRVLIEGLLHLLAARKLRLDEIGSASWLLLDGKHSVAEVANILRQRFGERVEPTEERLGHLVRVFRREGLVAYPGWDEV
jgi:hypothetical protein